MQITEHFVSAKMLNNVLFCFSIFIVHNFKKYMSLIKYTCLVNFASSRKQILYFLFSFYNF